MNLINGKTMYCPECGKPLDKYDGKINGNIAHVTAYCQNCNKRYHWMAAIDKNTKEHRVAAFSQYFKLD